MGLCGLGGGEKSWTAVFEDNRDRPGYLFSLSLSLCVYIKKVRTRLGDILVWFRGDTALSDLRGLQERHHGDGGFPESDHAP